MAGYGRLIQFEAQRELAFGGIVAGYTAIGGELAAPARAFKIDNQTDALLQFSFGDDDTPISALVDHFVMPASSSWIQDIALNRQGDTPFFLQEGLLLYVKRIGTPTSGSVYFSVMFGRGD